MWFPDPSRGRYEAGCRDRYEAAGVDLKPQGCGIRSDRDRSEAPGEDVRLHGGSEAPRVSRPVEDSMEITSI